MLTEDTKAILLLCGPLGDRGQIKPLNLAEYDRVAVALHQRDMRPADLTSSAPEEAASALEVKGVAPDRLASLLGRGMALTLSYEKWSQAGLWVLGRGDTDYPLRLKRRLGAKAPPLFFGAGDRRLLSMRGLAVVGSRDASTAALSFASQVGARMASEGTAIISGGARGVDRESMMAAVNAGGYSVGVLADSLLRAIASRTNRQAISSGHLLLLSPFHPDARFHVGNAMGRNKYIYCLAEAALVADSATSGGTWTGAKEALAAGWLSVNVFQHKTNGPGTRDLLNVDGRVRPIDEAVLQKPGSVLEAMQDGKESVSGSARRPAAQMGLFNQAKARDRGATEIADRYRANARGAEADNNSTDAKSATLVEEKPLNMIDVNRQPEPADAEASPPEPAVASLYEAFISLAMPSLLVAPLTHTEMATKLGILRSQAKLWAERAAEENRIQVVKKSPKKYGPVESEPG